jgi:hypothetical protein
MPWPLPPAHYRLWLLSCLHYICPTSSAPPQLLSTFVAIYLVDRAGRRKLFLEGGCQMFVAQARLPGLLRWLACRMNTGAEGACGVTRWAALSSNSLYPEAPVIDMGHPVPLAQVAVGILLGVSFSTYDTTDLPKSITVSDLNNVVAFLSGWQALSCMPARQGRSLVQL